MEWVNDDSVLASKILSSNTLYSCHQKELIRVASKKKIQTKAYPDIISQEWSFPTNTAFTSTLDRNILHKKNQKQEKTNVSKARSQEISRYLSRVSTTYQVGLIIYLNISKQHTVRNIYQLLSCLIIFTYFQYRPKIRVRLLHHLMISHIWIWIGRNILTIFFYLKGFDHTLLFSR